MNTHDAQQPPLVQTVGDVTTVTLSDNSVRDSEDCIAHQVDKVPAAPNQHLQLDFTNVDYLNGIELGTLIALHKRVRRTGGQLTLFNVAAHLRELFTVTRLDTVLTLYEGSNSAPGNSVQTENDQSPKTRSR